MEVIVTGARSSRQDWVRAQQWPADQLPPLTDDQRTAARDLGIPEEDYARSAYAGELSREELSGKAAKLGELLQTLMCERVDQAAIERVELNTFEGKFHAVAVARSRRIHLDIAEELVDELLASGSPALEQQLARIVELNLPLPEAIQAS